jgi:hypothetical protein
MSEQVAVRNLDNEPAELVAAQGEDEVRVRLSGATEIVLKKSVWESLPPWSGPTPV